MGEGFGADTADAGDVGVGGRDANFGNALVYGKVLNGFHDGCNLSIWGFRSKEAENLASLGGVRGF